MAKNIRGALGGSAGERSRPRWLRSQSITACPWWATAVARAPRAARSRISCVTSWTATKKTAAWGPVRPIFGTVRYMSSDNTQKKLWLARYLARYGEHVTLLK